MYRGKTEQLEKLIWDCCVDGHFHPENGSLYISESMGYKPFNEENHYKPLMQELQNLAELSGETVDDYGYCEELQEVSQRAEELVEKFKGKIEGYAREKRELAEQKERCREGIEIYSNFIDLDVSIELIDECEFILARFGRLPKESYMKLQVSSDAVSKSGEDRDGKSSNYKIRPYFMFLPCSSDASSQWGVYFTPKDKADDVDRMFASLHFERVEMPGAAGTPEMIIENLKNDIEIIDKSIEEADREAKAFFNENREECNSLYTALSALDKVFGLKKYAVVKDGYFFFVGWVTKKHLKSCRKMIENIEDVDLEVSTPEEDTTTSPPVKLRNPRIARPFEFFIDMYGLPGYNEVDITGFLAVTYTLLFGIMFGDMGQGIVLMIAGFLMWKLKKMDLGKALIPCGISATVFGFIYGSVFGFENLLDPVYRKLRLGGKPLEVMNSVNTILILAISIGIFLVAISMCINIYACFKRKEPGEALFSQNGVAGLLFYLALVSLCVTFMTDKEYIPSSLCVGILIVCAVILFMKEILIALTEHKKEKMPDSVGDFILQNIFELIEYVLSYASNTVSFLRVGAFVLVHAGMMMVVFELAGENNNLFVIILGNALVIALEGLLTGIQAMRLEFYEMFSRFYEGDGRPFEGVLINKTIKQSKNPITKLFGGKAL